MSTPNRILETITGRSKAIKRVKSWAIDFEDCNGADRIQVSESGLRADDQEGSGEFCEAVCVNANEAESCEAEVYQIEVCW